VLLLLLVLLAHVVRLSKGHKPNSPVQLPTTVQVCASPHAATKPDPVAPAVQFAVHVAPMGRLVQLASHPVLLEGAVALGAPEHVLAASRQQKKDRNRQSTAG
jgi:hypothetical protein